MDIAFVSLETTHHRESVGAQRFERVARLLAGQGHDVTIFCGQWWDDYRSEFTVGDVQYRGVTLGTVRSSFLARLPALIGRHNPDIVHVREDDPRQAVAALAGARMARAPLVVEWFGNEATSGRTLSLVGRTANAVITPSELAWTAACEQGATPDRTHIIPESIDFELVDSVEPATDVDIVCAQPLDGHDHLSDLLLGLAELRDRDWQAVVIGDGPRRSGYETETKELEIDTRVRFVGDVSREERLRLYRGAHVFVHTAEQTQFATELLWALACGCVGVVEYQEASSAHELIAHSKRGVGVANPRDISGAIADASERERRTRDETYQSYDHSAVVRQYLDRYLALLPDEASDG